MSTKIIFLKCIHKISFFFYQLTSVIVAFRKLRKNRPAKNSVVKEWWVLNPVTKN